MGTVLRRLNDEGLAHFSESIVALRNGSSVTVPFNILGNDRYTYSVDGAPTVEQREFSTRFEMGEYLVGKLTGFDWQTIVHDAGIWSWLALYYFDQLCPADATGKRIPSMEYQYVLSRDYRHHSRHALRTTCDFVRHYGPAVQFMFSKSPSERGEIVEQLSARQELAACPGVIQAASALYSDTERRTFRKGAAGRGRGSIVRLIKVLQQYQLTYDLYSVSGDQLLRLLPTEFDRFRPKGHAGGQAIISS